MAKFPEDSPVKEYFKRFGQIAVEREYITTDQLKKALSEQVDDDLAKRPHRYLGTILAEKNWMTGEQVGAILYEMLGVTRR